jgi:hypothetical protein
MSQTVKDSDGMSQRGASWGERPSKKGAAADVEQFVRGKPATKRLNVEIPAALHARVKARCALEGREMREVVIELLEQRFPE